MRKPERRWGVSGFSCSCGARYESADGLHVVGWQECGDGDLALLVNCRCRSTICALYLIDACLCAHCRQPILGNDGDVKVCVEPDIKLHLACARANLGRTAFLVPSMAEMMHFGVGAKTEPDASGYVPAAFVAHQPMLVAAEGAE